MAEDFGFFSSSSESGAPGEAEEDPAAAFLAQQESEIAGIERAEPPEPVGFGDLVTTPVNGDLFPENDPLGDGYSIIAQAQEPESIRRWREEQKKRLEELDAASKVTEQEWREKAKKDLEEWHIRQNEQMEKTKASNRASDENFISDSKDEEPGSEWEKVARLCDFNPKSSKQAKDVSRMRSVLISLKQSPLAC
ncbi:clathrin light chain B isoform X2 [Rhinatrema bivittatum]|uniref:clathrin light chain B isoform X2 n=1 Tax=Rhinatrema bivittatum TaxID=194408 RepID=UPI00112E45DB|nr:clathrin light chain B isoform X2 [Rhinatrema bivittatum]